MAASILVIGSMNMDLVVETDRYPVSGETVLGRSFNQIPGGKGANQAVAAGRIKGNVAFIGACGKDNYGDILIKNLEESGVMTEGVFRVDDTTGVALITIEGNGENRIVVVQGANTSLSPRHIDEVEEMIKASKMILLQLEISLKTVEYIVQVAKKYGKTVILDPAPARPLSESIFKGVDYLLPNEGELDQIIDFPENLSFTEKAEYLLDKGVSNLIVTRGEKGVIHFNKKVKKEYNAYQVKAKDTTAAGDAFAGAFACGLDQGWSEEKSIRFASMVAAISVTRLGAQSSLPSLSEVEEFQKERGLDL